ncbi:hypothetical protein POM88_006439 [Heracleum sosnowskyi]|uniref:ABC transporter domain-containing protein n=1 Tax=Heracleum sosnowskyi TaxID=360622 RepID=A0AAD8J3G4_9APIA|nr:hypothetical protein POM88_006439 [Heracleum sosnowskyi]
MAGDDLMRSMSRRASFAASASKKGWGASSIREAFTAAGGDVFQKSGRQEDEDDLKWAAIERLPTYDRLRKGFLKQVLENGRIVHAEIDLTHLGVDDKKNLMENVQRVIDDDNERLLQRLRDRIDRVGIDVPKIEIRFQQLSVEGDAFVGSRALPTLLNSTINSVEAILGFLRLFPSKKRVVNILHEVSGIVKPSRMTLLLGPPGSGKTTLLKAIAGKLDLDLRETGNITYCGHDMREFVPQRTCAYISQHDLHHGEMTVRETMDFSGRCLGVGTRYEMLAELSRREKVDRIKPDPEIDAFMKAISMSGQETSLITDYVLKILGLDICSNTMVGDEMRRGISGGQKKRVTTGEMLEQEQYWFKKDEPYRYVSVCEFVHRFNSFHVGRKISAVLSSPFDRSKAHPAALVNDKYGISNKELFKACLSREWLLMKRNSFVYIFKTTQITIMALFTFTVFFRTEMKYGEIDDGGKFYGALFFSLINVMFNGMAELALTMFRLPVFFKQRDALFYPAWAFALPIWLLRLPLSVMESGIWILLTYYTVGFAPSASRFFRQFLAFLGIHQMALGLFRFIAALGRTQVVANTLGTFTLLLVFVLGGFIIAKDDLQPWMKWAYYLSPMSYGQNALVINEFLDPRWNTFINDSMYPDTTAGKVLLEARGMFVEDHWYWLCVIALFAFSLFFNLCFVGALTFLNPLGETRSIASEDTDENDNKKRPLSEDMDMGEMNSNTENNVINRKGMVLPFEPLSLAFDHMNYYVDMPAEMKSQGIEENRLQLLRNVSGAFRPDVDEERRKMFVEEVMDLVELNSLRNALVGLPGVDGLSTEQRKRLTIAVELVANPSIIFMDEPTSGLDARAAAIVMRAVRNTVDTGRTVVCTIHQPSIDIFEAFDELFLMKRGGQVIYAGPLGHYSQILVDYFESIPGVAKIKDGYNPATWMLEVSSAAIEAQLDVDFAEIFANSNQYRSNQELIKDLSTPKSGSKDLYFPTQYSQPFITQFKACFWKQHWSYWRNPQYNAIRFFMTAVIGLIFGIIFWKKGDNMHKQQDLSNLMGAMYAAVLFLGGTNTSAVQSVVAIERTVFYRERAAGMYSPLPYAFAQVALLELVLRVSHPKDANSDLVEMVLLGISGCLDNLRTSDISGW